MEQIVVEKTASRGIAVAPVYLCQEPDLSPVLSYIPEKQIPEELERLRRAVEHVQKDLEVLAEENALFEAHLLLLKDQGLLEQMKKGIRDQHKNAELALFETIKEIAGMFAAMKDPYMSERADDIRDMGKRLMAALKGVCLPDLGEISREVIVVAKDLYPSDTVKLDPARVQGILTEEGGVTSHVSILAKNRNIPILVGVKGITGKVKNGDLLCMDAEKGMVILDPAEEIKRDYQERKELQKREQKELWQYRKEPAVTRDGRRIRLCANVGNPGDIREALPMNMDGVGLFRTELLYMESSHFPTEEEQFAVYRDAAELCPGELTIRTLDIGGDKELPYFSFEKENNPFLGWRAIRISLDRKELFKEQLRAILRAGAYGRVRILLPMIVSLEELREARKLAEICKEELRAEGKAFDENMKVGMMMETPASVILAEEFAGEADFFSIGTNDLTQYLLAADRSNPRLAGLCDDFHPAVLKAIGQIIKAGRKAGIPVGMCGEMAGNPKATALLLDMGLSEFSMAPGSMDYVRKEILDYPRESWKK